MNFFFGFRSGFEKIFGFGSGSGWSISLGSGFRVPDTSLCGTLLTVVGCDVIITAGELGVDEVQLDVFEDEFGNGSMTLEAEPRKFGEGVLI